MWSAAMASKCLALYLMPKSCNIIPKNKPLTCQHAKKLLELDIATLGGIHPIDQSSILRFDHLTLKLLGGSELVALLREVCGQDAELLNLERIVRANFAVVVGRSNR